MTAEQAPGCNSIGAKIANGCIKRYFDFFDGAPQNVTAPDMPIAVSKRMEQLTIPAVEDIMNAIRKAARREV